MRTEVSLRQIIDINLNRFKYVAKYVLFMFCFMVVLTTIISIFMFFNVVGLRWMNAVIGVVVILGFVLLCVSKSFLGILRQEIKRKSKRKDDLQQYYIEYPKHIIAVMGVVWNLEGKVLLIRSPRRGWEPPGGQVENGEDILSGLKREVMEESGIIIQIGKLVALYSNLSDPTKLMLTFEAIAISGTLQTSEESLEVGWFSPEEAIEKVTHSAQKQKLQDALNSGKGIIYRVYRTHPYELLKAVIV